MKKVQNISVYTDGGARGNPGPAAIGVFVEKDNQELVAIGKTIGEDTNNGAEYKAVIEGLTWLIENKEKVSESNIIFYVDSQLVSSQLQGIFKVKNARIRELIFVIREKEAELAMPVNYIHIPREKNKKADLLVNLALDKKI